MQATARSPRTDARGFMAAVSGYVSSSEGAGGTKVRIAVVWSTPQPLCTKEVTGT